jgi:oxygen-independent coproporphyrinogen-3 oxidase
VTGQDRVEEALMMGLRLADGIDRALFASVAGADPVEALGEARLAPLVRAGFLDVRRPAISRRRRPGASA